MITKGSGNDTRPDLEVSIYYTVCLKEIDCWICIIHIVLYGATPTTCSMKCI